MTYCLVLDRDEDKVNIVAKYLASVGMLRDYSNDNQDPIFSEIVSLDLSTVVSSVSGPKRPHDRVSVTDMKNDFLQCLSNKVRDLVLLQYSRRIRDF